MKPKIQFQVQLKYDDNKMKQDYIYFNTKINISKILLFFLSTS